MKKYTIFLCYLVLYSLCCKSQSFDEDMRKVYDKYLQSTAMQIRFDIDIMTLGSQLMQQHATILKGEKSFFYDYDQIKMYIDPSLMLMIHEPSRNISLLYLKPKEYKQMIKSMMMYRLDTLSQTELNKVKYLGTLDGQKKYEFQSEEDYIKKATFSFDASTLFLKAITYHFGQTQETSSSKVQVTLNMKESLTTAQKKKLQLTNYISLLSPKKPMPIGLYKAYEITVIER